MSKEDERYGWWGKFKKAKGGNFEKVWVGPMSRQEMLEKFPDYRHNFKKTAPEDSQEKQ